MGGATKKSLKKFTNVVQFLTDMTPLDEYGAVLHCANLWQEKARQSNVTKLEEPSMSCPGIVFL